MTRNITTWSPDTCRCELNYITDSDIPNSTEFYAISYVCPLHEHLATKIHHPMHLAKSTEKFKDIEAAMARNLAQHDAAVKRAHLRTHKKQLEELTSNIHKHNMEVKERWEDIFNEPYSHDVHIYDVILAENQTKNIAHGDLVALGHNGDEIKWELIGRAPDREVHLTLPKGAQIDTEKHLASKKYKCKVVIHANGN